jgi:hypothetical protein
MGVEESEDGTVRTSRGLGRIHVIIIARSSSIRLCTGTIVSDRVHGKDAEARVSGETVVQIYTMNSSMRANAEEAWIVTCAFGRVCC